MGMVTNLMKMMKTEKITIRGIGAFTCNLPDLRCTRSVDMPEVIVIEWGHYQDYGNFACYCKDSIVVNGIEVKIGTETIKLTGRQEEPSAGDAKTSPAQGSTKL